MNGERKHKDINHIVDDTEKDTIMNEIKPVATWETHCKRNPSCAEQAYMYESEAKSIEIDELRTVYEAQATRIAKLEEIINQKNILKTLVLFQTECEILADTFRNGNMASKAIGKIDLVKFMDKWDKLNSEVK